MSNKLTLDLIDRLILESLGEKPIKEAEYVTGSKLPKKKGSFDFGEPWFGQTIRTSTDFKKNIEKLAKFCDHTVENPKVQGVDLGSRFKRMMAIEMLHKFLNISIPETDEMGFNPYSSGFGMETMLVNLFRGEIINADVDDIVFKATTGNQSKYSVKYYTKERIGREGFGQAFGTLDKWLTGKNTSGFRLNYVVCVKFEDSENVGIEVRFKTFTVGDIKQIAKKELQEIQNLQQQLEILNSKSPTIGIPAKIQHIRSQIQSLKKKVILYKGPAEDLDLIDVIKLPRDIKKLMNVTYEQIEDDIKNLYTALDRFKESLVEYHKASKTPAERRRSIVSYNELRKAAREHLNPTPYEYRIKKENKNKSKKDLDKLIQEVILDKNK
jgi:hypothetical protein